MSESEPRSHNLAKISAGLGGLAATGVTIYFGTREIARRRKLAEEAAKQRGLPLNELDPEVYRDRLAVFGAQKDPEVLDAMNKVAAVFHVRTRYYDTAIVTMKNLRKSVHVDPALLEVALMNLSGLSTVQDNPKGRFRTSSERGFRTNVLNYEFGGAEHELAPGYCKEVAAILAEEDALAEYLMAQGAEPND